MRYYKHNIGDYAQATAHLSMTEEGAYRRLLDLCYSTEAPLPADVTRVCRLVRATTRQERAAVEAVLAEFFDLTDDGYRQRRVERELVAMGSKVEANRTNGRRGGRPKRNPTDEKQKPSGFQNETLPTTHYPLLQTSSKTLPEDARPENDEGRDEGGIDPPSPVARFRQRFDGSAGGYAGDDRSAPGKVAAAIAQREADRRARGE